MEETVREVIPRRRRKRKAAAVLLALLVLLLLALWLLRLPIATDFLRREFERRDVKASYRITHIGFGRQRVENLVIGDPRNPDLTARSVELRVSWGFRRPRITLVTARGVRLRGRVVGRRVSFGQVDKLLPPPTGAPFRLPDQAIDVADASVRLETPAGLIGIGLAGRGSLADGFRGEMATASHGLRVGSCAIARPRSYWRVAIDDRRPRFAGPLNAAGLACGADLAVTAPEVVLEAALTETLQAWRGKAAVTAGGARLDANALGGIAGALDFAGNAETTRGAVDLAAASARIGSLAAGRTRIDGRYSLSLKTGAASLLADVGANSVSAGAIVEGVAGALASAGGTPVEPVGEALAAAIRRAAAAFDLAGSLRVTGNDGGGALRFERLVAISRSGARLALEGGDGATYAWPSGLARIDGDVSLTGGGFPAIRFGLTQPRLGGPIRGVGRVAPLVAGGSRLVLGDILFTADPGGATRIDTVATVDGAFDDGRVGGLVLPISGRIDGRGGFAFGERCVAARFRGLQTGTLRLGPSTLPLCPTGRAILWKAPGGSLQGGASLRPVRFAGTLGASPIRLSSSRLQFGIDGPNFDASGLEVDLGGAESRSAFRLASITGRFDRPGVGGRFSGLSAAIAKVPFDLSQGAGTWSVKDGDLLILGGLRVADTANPPRFHPVVSRDVRLTLADNRIEATGSMLHPETGTRIMDVAIAHALRSGEGRAVLDMPGIRFDKDFQPERITPLTTGVVALVNGVIKGRGEIAWRPGAIGSSGTFSTDDLDFAAAFGPVEGVRTSLHFTDLLGLTSAPGQVAEIGLARLGIDVFDGRIRYQLLPGRRVKIEGGRWPFAGGELLLEETVLDFSQPSAKRLTFRVVGLDAALFVQKMEFANISATGTFDGVIPMVFDQNGGRVEGGSLVARPEGGTLSYVGELTDKELGTYGKLAFDALKSLRYNKLAITLNGSLAGEFVAGIELDGVARDPAATVVRTGGGIQGLVINRAIGQLRKIPFEFNITVRGPFRTLLATMRSFEDPSDLIQSVLPEKLRPQDPLVQPQESEIVR